MSARSTLANFIRHAELFGIECVAETAVDYLCRSELERLQIELDAIERERKAGRFTVGKRRRRSELETVRYAAALAQELSERGLGRVALEQAIADKLGVSDAYARRVLKLGREMSEGAPKRPRKRPVQAESFATNRQSGVALPSAGVTA